MTGLSTDKKQVKLKSFFQNSLILQSNVLLVGNFADPTSRMFMQKESNMNRNQYQLCEQKTLCGGRYMLYYGCFKFIN